MRFMSYAAAATLAAAFTITTAQAADISGAGATFPYPIYAKWADAYKKETGIGLNYQSIGSGGGIKQIEAKHRDLRRLAISRCPARSSTNSASPSSRWSWAASFRSSISRV